MVQAQQRRAIERHVLDKLEIRRLDVIEIAIMVEMFGLDIGDDSDRPVEMQDNDVALVGIDQQPVRRADPGVRAINIEIASARVSGWQHENISEAAGT